MISRKFALVCALIAGICFMVGGLISWQTPKLRSLIMVKIEQATHDKLPVLILPTSVEVTFFPLGASLQKVNLVPKEEIRAWLEPATFESIGVRISPWQLLRGKLRLTQFDIVGARIVATLPHIDKKPKTGPPLAGLFDALNQLPVNRIKLSDVSIRLRMPEQHLRLELSNLALLAERRRGGLVSLDLNSANLSIAKDSPDKATPALRLQLEASATMNRDDINVPILKINAGDWNGNSTPNSWINSSAHLVGDVESLKFKESDIHVKTELGLTDLSRWAKATFPQTMAKVPPLSGNLAFEAKGHRVNETMPSAEFSLKTEALHVGDFLVDKLTTAGTLNTVGNGKDRHEEISIPKVELEHPAGLVDVDQLLITLGETKKISAKIKIGGDAKGSVQLQQILQGIGKHKIPAWVQVSGEAPCEGTLAPTLSVTCKGQLQGENILVRADMEAKSSVVAIRKIDVDGEVTLDKDKVVYSAELTAPDSKGRSSGTIDFDTGFKIDYEADRLAMADVANLADLKIEGTAKVRGSTEGNSDVGVFNMEVDATDAWLEDFWLGNAKGSLGYKDGKLDFTGVQGYYTVSRYSGQVQVDLDEKKITIGGRVPFFDARDLLKIFSRKVKLPFGVTGTGQAQVQVSGPFAFNKLSYDLKSSLYRGAVATETFDQITFNVKSVNGEVKSQKIALQKVNSSLVLAGEGHPNGLINTVLHGRNFALEDSQIISSSNLALSGNVNFDMDMVGPVLSPDTDMRGKITKTTIGDQPMPDSTFQMKFSSKTVEGQGDFLGDVLKTTFVFPLNDTAPFSLKMKTVDWNYAPLFAALAGVATRKDYEGRLTSVVDLSSATGGFWNASGAIDVANFSLSHGSLSLHSSEPLSLTMKNGAMKVKKFDLGGENVFLKISENPHPNSKIDLQVNGKLDLTLLALLTPFFEDLRGLVSFAFNVKANPDSIDLLGSAYVDKGYLKFFDFPHAIEDIRADMLFNQKKILFNTLKAEIGGGKIGGSGSMELKGYKNLPVNVGGTFEKVSLNVPEKVKTTGSGNWTFTGSWFPFLLKGNYDIKEGLITKEIGGDAEANKGLRRDQFLPDMLVQDRFVPLNVDIDVNFTKGMLVRNELLDGRVTGEFTVKGNPTKPSLLGQVVMEKDTKLIVKDTTFEVTNSNIQLTDPNEINPKLYIAARAHVQEYDVNLTIQGTGNNPQLSFTSSPALAEKDIISLLAIGTTDSQNINPAIQATQVNQQQNLQQAQINSSSPLKDNPLSKEIKERTGFDVQFAPGFDESAATQKIIVRKQFSNKLSVAASQSMGSQRASDAEVRYRLNDRVSGIFSWQNADNLDTLDKTQSQEQNQFGLDLEYKFEFK